MNERIKELWAQAGGTFTSGNQHEWPSARIDNPEKFAELIVEECGEIAYKAYWGNPETVRGIHIKEKIKQHFGVEE